MGNQTQPICRAIKKAEKERDINRLDIFTDVIHFFLVFPQKYSCIKNQSTEMENMTLKQSKNI